MSAQALALTTVEMDRPQLYRLVKRPSQRLAAPAARMEIIPTLPLAEMAEVVAVPETEMAEMLHMAAVAAQALPLNQHPATAAQAEHMAAVEAPVGQEGLAELVAPMVARAAMQARVEAPVQIPPLWL